MSAKQLTLRVDPDPLPDRSHTTANYFVYRVTVKDERTPRNRAHRALGMYEGRFVHKPREILCHEKNAAEIGPDVMGVQVLVLPTCAPDEFWLGPKEA